MDHPSWELLALDQRRRIFETVEANQGAHLRELGRRSGIPIGTALYHLGRLESAGLVVVHRDGRYKRYFAGHTLELAEKATLIALRHALPLRIAQVLLDEGEGTQRALGARLGISRSSMSSCLNDLLLHGILQRTAVHPEMRYQLSDRALTARVVHAHGASLGAPSPEAGGA